MRHSVIIPHRGRARYLDQCLLQLCRSAVGHDVEVCLVHESTESTWRHKVDGVRLHELWIPRRGRFFNKPILLNAGIEASSGEVVTFLDADALVGGRFFEAASLALAPRLTKVCYRVRMLPTSALDDLEADAGREPQIIDGWFDRWEQFTPAVEAYGEASSFTQKGGDPVYGNSQFSIAREKLGALRFDERFESAGYEDIWFNREIAYHYGAEYKALMITDPDHAMFHVRSEREEDWLDPASNLRNTMLYERERERKGG